MHQPPHSPSPLPSSPRPEHDAGYWKLRAAQLEKELLEMKERSIEMFSRTEVEEEGLINKLISRLNELKKEKEHLAIEVEREEEMISNTLQKKLTKVLQEKVDLGNQLEAEQEAIVNKLGAEISKLRKEKEALVMEVEREEELLTNTLSRKLDRERRDKEDLGARLLIKQVQVQELKKMLKEDARLILQLKDVIETVTDKGQGLPFKPEDRDLILQISDRLVERLILLESSAGGQGEEVRRAEEEAEEEEEEEGEELESVSSTGAAAGGSSSQSSTVESDGYQGSCGDVLARGFSPFSSFLHFPAVDSPRTRTTAFRLSAFQASSSSGSSNSRQVRALLTEPKASESHTDAGKTHPGRKAAIIARRPPCLIIPLLPPSNNQATGAASSQTSSLGGVEDLDHDDHVALSVLDEGVGHNSELRRSESNATSVVPKQRLSQSFLGLAGSSSKARKLMELGNPHGAGIALGGMADAVALSAATAAGGRESWRDREAASDAHHGHERPSFRVIGVQISHMSRTGQFLFCSLGVFSFLLVYGFLQEYMVIHVFQRQLGIFLTLCQFAGYSSLAALHRLIHVDTPRRIPFGYYVLLATLQAMMQGLTNLSMRWLNYPAKMLFKSSRVIPTMIVGVFIMKKRYKIKDYMVVALLALGLVFFIQADVKVSPSFHPLGIIFISMALAVDAAIVNIQEYTLRKYDASHDELIFYSYGLGSFILLAYCLLSKELYDGIVFLRAQPPLSTLCLIIFCSCGYFGVTCVAALTKKFGALASTMTTTARKALTLFLSFFIFPKPATGMHVFGGVMFVLGLSVKAVPTGRNKDCASSSSASSSIPSTSSAATLLSSSSRSSLKSKQIRSLLSSSAAVPPSSSAAAAAAVATTHQKMGSIGKSIELV